MELRLQHAIAILRLGLLCLIVGLTTTAARAMASSEYQLKAVFLFNFAQFVQWPAQAFESEQAPLVICVLGPDPFGAELEAVMEGERISGRPISIQRLDAATAVDACHLLFIGEDAESELRTALARLEGRPVLTVGETTEFIAAGGMIRFYMEGNRVRLQINPSVAEESQLRVSSKLLRSSQIVAKAER
jgi:hypothetical protein